MEDSTLYLIRPCQGQHCSSIRWWRTKFYLYFFFIKKGIINRVLQAGKWNFEKSQKRSRMTFLGLKMIIFGHFSRFLASFKISFSSLQHPNYKPFYCNGLSVNSYHSTVIRKRRRSPVYFEKPANCGFLCPTIWFNFPCSILEISASAVICSGGSF